MTTTETQLGDPGTHPSEEDWERLAMGELTADQRTSLMDHAVACGDCREVLTALGDLEAAAVAADEELVAAIFPSTTRARSGPSWRIWLPMAAAASIVLLLVVRPERVVEQSVPRLVPTQRSVAGLVAEPILLSPTETSTLVLGASGPIQFHWEPVQGASSYRFELLDGGAEPLWSADLTDSSIAWPAGIEPVAGSYYWRVGVTLGAGGAGTSGLTRFEISE